MSKQRIIKDTSSISELFKNLERQKEISVSIRYNDKQLPGRLVFNNKTSEEPIISYSYDYITLENGDIVEISFFYKDTFFTFETRVIDAGEKSFCFIKPHLINASFGRSSTRYLIKKDENISLKINEINSSLKIIDISTSGLSIESPEDILKTEAIIRNSLLNINDQWIYFDAVVKYVKQYKSAYVYGLNFINIEWETSQIIFKYIFEKAFPNLKSLSDYTEEERDDLYNKSNNTGIKLVGDHRNEFFNVIRKFDCLINKPTISINLTYHKNDKISGFISALRIYNRTFSGFPPALLPETYLNPKANVDIFIGLAEHLLIHPYFDNFITYIDPELDWYQRTFDNIYQIINDNEKYSLDTCIYHNYTINDFESGQMPMQYKTEILDEPDEFMDFCGKKLSVLENSCFGYNSNDSFSLNEIKGIYHTFGYSMSRRIFRTEKNGTTAAFTVAECYHENVNVNNSLDSIRVYFLDDKVNKEDVLCSLLPEVSLYYNINNRKHFRIYLLSNTSNNFSEMNIPGLEKGVTTKRVLMKKDGLLEFVRLLKANFEYYTKFYNLSQPQKSIWYTEKVFPGTSIGNIVGTLKIKDEVDVALLEKAINIFVEKNDAMRIRIVEENDIPKQYISNYSYFKVDYLDFSNCDINEYYKWDEEQSRKAFTLIDSPLFYFAILKLKPKLYAFYANTHHLISDAWTMNLLGGEIFEFYKYLRNNFKITNAKKPSYLDYVLSEEEYKFSDKYEKNKEFWSKIFETIPEFMSFKTDSNVKSVKANRKTFILPEKVSRNIQSYCKKMKTSVFSLFFSALSLYISRSTGCEDIVIGTPILNRSNVKEKETIGMFINSVPVRLQVNHHIEFSDYLNYVTKEINACLKNQKYNYDMILSDFRSKHKVSTKLFDVVISYQNSKYEKGNNGNELEARWHFNYNQLDSLVIHLDDREDDGQYLLKFDYLVDVFSGDEIEKIYDYLINIIAEANDNPDYMLKDLNMYGDEEKKKLSEFIYSYNNSASNYPKEKTIIQLFEEQTAKTPDNIALEYEGNTISYAELNRKSNQLARRLREKGIKGDNIVGLMLDHSFEMVIGILGILKSGGAYLPIDPGYPQDRIAYMIDNSEADILLTDDSNVDKVSFSGHIINIGDSKLFTGNDNNLNIISNSSNLAYIIYTSGSTGKPKGAMITNQGLVNYINWADKMYVRGDKVAFALYSSISFDLTVTSVFTPLVTGNKIVIYRNDNSEPLVRRIFREKKVQVVKVTPAHLQLVKDIDNRNSSIQRLILGGEDLKTKLCRNIYKSFEGKIEIYNEYGPTETVVGCMIYKFNYEKDNRTSVPIGKPADNVQIYLLDKYLNPVPYGMPGEIYISGDGLARGYLNKNKLTNERFIENPFEPGTRMYKTGDLAVMLNDGNMEYIGRIDNQVKINGYRIELGEIESEILKYEAVKSVVVLDLTDNDGRKYLRAYIIKKDDFNLDSLKNKLNKVLPTYMVPASFVFIEKIPLTSNGKVDRKFLEKLKPESNDLSNYVAPTNVLERYLEEVVCNILGLEKVSTEDNFFEIGLDSLSAMHIVSALMSKGWELTIQDIYNHNTIKALSEKLTSGSQADAYAAAATEETESLNNKIELAKIPEKITTREFKHVFLTGATGYLGVHILNELIDSDNTKITCLVRGQDNNNAKERLLKALDFYFPNKYESIDENRVVVLSGDITIDKFGLNKSEYYRLAEEIDGIFHIGALVKLFGNYSELEKVNVEGTRRIIDFAEIYNKPIRYASTVSISGNYLVKQKCYRPTFSESSLYVGQSFEDNVYVRSKFEAEKIIIDNINKGLDAIIFRIGDLTNRFSDGTFQIKAHNKFTFQLMRAIVEIGIIPEQILSEEIEFSPVDYASKAFVLLSCIEQRNTNVFHLFNSKRFTVEFFLFNILKPLGFNFEILKGYSFNEYIQYIKRKSNKKVEISYLANNFNYDCMFSEMYRVNLKSEYTEEYLRKLDFKWPDIKDEYLDKVVNNLRCIGFFTK